MKGNLRCLMLVALLAPACSNSPSKGIRVDIDMAGFQNTAATLKLTVSAYPGGFVGNMPTLADQSVTISYDASNELVMTFERRRDSSSAARSRSGSKPATATT